MKPDACFLAILFTALAAAPPARAADFTFTGTTPGTTTWSSGTDWDVVPVSGSDTALIFGTGQTVPAGVITHQDIASPPFLLNSLTNGYGSGTSNFVIQGSALSFVSNGATTPTIVLNSTAQLQMSSAVNFGNNTAISGAKDILFTGAITNTGGAVVTKSGAGTMRIASDNAGYTGDFNVTGGTLQLGNNSSAGDAGSGTVTLFGGGSFVVRRNSGTLALNNTITGTGNVKFQTRNFTATINKANPYIGNTTLEPSGSDTPGGIKLGIDNGLPSATAFTINNNGTAYQTFNLNGFNQALGSLATGSGGNTTNSIVTNSGAAKTLTISSDSGSTTYAGLISGNIDLTKSGGSTLVLSGANSYSGVTTVNDGVLRISNGGGLGTANTTSIAGNLATGRVELAGDISSGESFQISMRQGAALDAPALSNLSGNNTITGAIRGVTGGARVNIESQAGLLTLAGGLSQTSGTGVRTWQLMGAGNGLVTGAIGNGTADALALLKSGSGTWTLSGTNSYTGSTTVSVGTLALGAGGSISNSSELNVRPGASFDVTALGGGLALSSGQTLSGSGSLVGALTVSSGASLAPGTGGVGTLTLSGGLVVANGGHLALELNGVVNHDSIVVSGGNVSLAGDLAGTVLGYTPAIGDTFFLVRNTGAGATIGTLAGTGDGDRIEVGGKWFRLSLTSDFGGSGFAVGGAGNDVAIQRIDDPTPSSLAVSISGPTNTAALQLQLTWTDHASNETGYRVYRLASDNSLMLVATLPADATSFSETAANYTTHTYAVQAFDAGGPIGDLVSAVPLAVGSSLTERHDAMLDWIASNVPNLTQFGGGPHRIGRIGFWDGEARILRGETATGLSYITTAIEDASAENSNAGFSMFPGMDAWFRYNSLFPQSLKDRYQQVYTTSDLYDNGGTPNQRFMICTASYLANSVWGSAVNSVSSAIYDGFTDPTGKGYLVKEIERVPFRGFSEHDSNIYLTATLSALETLAQFAPDADVRNKARMALDWGFANAASHWLNGHWGVSSTRGSTGGEQNYLHGTAHLWWLQFGGPSPDLADTQTFMPFLFPEFPGLLPEVRTAGRERQTSYTRRSFATRNVSVINAAYFKQSWMTPRYTLWSQAEGRVTFNGDNSINLVDMNPSYIQDGYQGERWALAWDSPPGNDAKLKITTPTTYGTSTSGISIWEDTLQHEDTMIAVYNMPVGGGGNTGNDGNWANEFLRGHIPAGWQAITDEAATTGRIFIHYDSVLVAVYLDRTFSWTTDFTVNGVNKAALAIETAPVSGFPQGTATDRLAAFRSAVLANAPDTSNITAAAPRFIYTNRHGDVLDLTYGLAGKINGVTVDYQSWPVLEDPWMYQAQNGHLHLFGANRVVTNNYYDWSQSINTRPVISANTSVPAVAASPVDVDLAARVADGETADPNLFFKASNPSGGTVALLADGHTARFTPTAGSSGAAAFDFTVSDRGTHPRVVWHYDFDSTATRDASGQARDSTLSLVGTGTAALQSDVPAALGTNSTQSLRLTEASTNAAKLSRLVTRTNLEMSNGSWTFATWFKRASRTTDDFIFYVGAGDGFGGGEELQLRCAANADTLRLEHYDASNVTDVTIISPGTAVQNVWHHAAVTFEKTADNTGTVRLYLNGTQVGAPTTVTWSLAQNVPVILGGHASSSFAVQRYFDGWLDDASLFRGAMTASEIASLAKQSVATFSGLSVAATVPLSVDTQQQNWRQTYFGTTQSVGNAADLFDGNGDGEVNLMEFATAQNPNANSRATPTLLRTGATLAFTYTRSLAALADGVSFTVKWSDTLAADSWSRAEVTEQILSDNGIEQSVKATFPVGGGAKRFVRLEVTSP